MRLARTKSYYLVQSYLWVAIPRFWRLVMVRSTASVKTSLDQLCSSLYGVNFLIWVSSSESYSLLMRTMAFFASNSGARFLNRFWSCSVADPSFGATTRITQSASTVCSSAYLISYYYLLQPKITNLQWPLCFLVYWRKAVSPASQALSQFGHTYEHYCVRTSLRWAYLSRRTVVTWLTIFFNRSRLPWRTW